MERSAPRAEHGNAGGPLVGGPLAGGPLAAVDFAAHFRDSFRTLWCVAVGVVHDAGRAEDVVQESAIIGLEKLNEFAAGTNFAAWMSRIVRNVALNTVRRERRRRVTSLETGSDGAPLNVASRSNPSNEAVTRRGELLADQTDFDDRVVAALDDVGETARACLLLRTLAGLEYSEIAALLDIPPGTAMSHVHRTRLFLRERLSGETGSAVVKKGGPS